MSWMRYRGYVYDTESELYYLQSRYYDPEVGRFLNADSFASTGQGLLGNNMFAYCNNNPVNLSDYSGNKPGVWFKSIDEAARDAALYIGEVSFENGWEYAVAIYARKRYKLVTKSIETKFTFCGREFQLNYLWFDIEEMIEYTYTEMATSQDPFWVAPPAPMFGKTLAIVHTHPMGSGSGITKFSDYNDSNDGDIPLADRSMILMYVYGPNGQMRKYDPYTGEDSLLFSDLPRSPYTPWLE